MYRSKRFLVILAASVSLAGAAQEKPAIKHAPTPNVDPASGREMYQTYCAVCHGVDGKGKGPAAPALKQAPTDLTLLSKRNAGEFPMFRVSNTIQGDSGVAAHGSSDMPMWGDLFRGLKRDDAMVKLRVHNLAQYLASLQEK